MKFPTQNVGNQNIAKSNRLRRQLKTLTHIGVLFDEVRASDAPLLENLHVFRSVYLIWYMSLQLFPLFVSLFLIIKKILVLRNWVSCSVISPVFTAVVLLFNIIREEERKTSGTRVPVCQSKYNDKNVMRY